MRYKSALKCLDHHAGIDDLSGMWAVLADLISMEKIYSISGTEPTNNPWVVVKRE